MFSTIGGARAEDAKATEMIAGEDEYMDIILLLIMVMSMLKTIKIAAPEGNNDNDDDDHRNQLSLLLLLVTIETTLDRTLCMLWTRKRGLMILITRGIV